jgi:hypothetical protein
MLRYGILAALGLLLLWGVEAKAHEMTPTYPEWDISHVDGIYKTRISLFNKRSDVEFYEIGVFDEEWNNVQFVSMYKVVHMPYLSHVDIDVYVSLADVPRAEYICSISKLRENSDKKPMVSSRICSRFK